MATTLKSWSQSSIPFSKPNKHRRDSFAHRQGNPNLILVILFSDLYYFQIHLRHLLAPFPRLRPLIPLSVALLRCVSFALASAKNSLRILAHSHLEIV